MTTRRWIFTAISFLLAIGASALIIRSSWSEEGARVGLSVWAHLACFTAAFLELSTRAIKIRLGGAALRIPFGLRTSFRAALGGDFGASITPARSGAEPARFLILREAGLPLPETNRPAGGRRVDCRWPDRRLTVELDSYTYHRSRHAWEQDRRREREARARGDELRRYTHDDVMRHPRLMLAELRELLPGDRPVS